MGVTLYGPHSPYTKELLHACLKVKVKLLRHVQPFATPWTVAFQAPLSMGFSRQEYWSGVPRPSPLFLLARFEPRGVPSVYISL